LAAWLRFAKLNLNTPPDFWNNVLWTDETTKVEMFGHKSWHQVRAKSKCSLSAQTTHTNCLSQFIMMMG